MGKKILTTILLSALNCAIAVVKEIESCDEITIEQEVIKMGKTILTAIIVAVLDCAIAAVKELGD